MDAFKEDSFQLTTMEYEDLMRFQNVTASNTRNKSLLPWVYSERGAYKISMYLTNDKAKLISDTILDAFFYLRDKILNEAQDNYVTQREFQILSN